MPIYPLSILTVVSALLCISGHYLNKKILTYIFKPLTTILIITMALLASRGNPTLYSSLILGGLVCSLFGDVFLMLPSDKFIAGLVSFLLAHLLYIAAFVTTSHHFQAPLFLASLLVLFVLSRPILPHTADMKIPVAVYMTVIVTMLWRAWAMSLDTGSTVAALGATVFVISDLTLALNRFRKPFASAEGIVLGTYWLAQGFIAISIGWFGH